ncbi:MAG: hypothetical protein GYA29_07435 [Methanothrix sp.]|nr:hypothetical protein [Methanothrix sp.]
MTKILAALLVTLLLGSVAVASAGDTKTNVGTFTYTNVYFKSPELNKDVGGGYTVSTSASGDDETVLDFKTEANFNFVDGRSVSINTGVLTSASGAKSFGMVAALTQTIPTTNGYRISQFRTHSSTFTPYLFAIQQLSGGELSSNSAGGYNMNTVKIGENEYDFGAASTLTGSTLSDIVYDPSISDISGFGWENGFDYIDSINECGLEYTGALSTNSILLVG